MSQRNHLLEAKITASPYKSANALAKAIHVPSNNIFSYLTCKRRPVDCRGALKYDAALLCYALDCHAEDIFPEGQIDTPYVILENYPQCEESDISYDPQKIRYHAHTPIVKMITLSTDHLAELQSLHKATAIGASALLKGQRQHLPIGLHSNIINGWLKGTISTARKDHLDFVLTLWRSKQDDGFNLVPITPSLRQTLRHYRDTTRIGAIQLFKQIATPPNRAS